MAASSVILPTFARGAHREPVLVETEGGRLRGLRHNGAVSFKGVPYAADTGGPNRFMAPQPVQPWTGVRDAQRFGDRSPQARMEAPSGPAPVTYSENCCVLNVYAPDLDRGADRPVLVYFHGGGFHSGSGDGPSIEGSNLALFGDLVVVTVNHRLNVFGYVPLGLVDPDFADAANAGQLDQIAALEWVQRNIGAFGGDPTRVTIAGQSGGGSKVTALQVMPGATGLFHRTINMSGSSVFGMERAIEREPIIRDFMRRLEIAPGDVRRLQQIRADQLIAAHNAATTAAGVYDYRPVVDGHHILSGPMSADGLAMQAAVPGIMSWTATEASVFIAGGAERFQVTEDAVKARVAGQFDLNASQAQSVWDGYQLDEPDRSPWMTLAAVATDALSKTPMRKSAEARAALGHQPVYVSEFTWASLAEGGQLGAPHGIDIPFAFGNLGQDRNTQGAGADAEEASRNQMAIFSAFIRDGDPNNARIPTWTPYDTARRPTMVINARCELVPDYRSGDRRTADTLPMQDTSQLMAGPLFRG
jgi:para-nitrobenzyl esterase